MDYPSNEASDAIMDHIVPLEETQMEEQLAYLNAGGEPQADEPDG